MKYQHLDIRPFVAATDTEVLSGIWFDASMNAHAFIGESRLLDQRLLIETEYLPKSETWVACRATGPVGFISLLGTFVGGIFVAPNCQGQGIGRKLIAHALDRRHELSLEVYLQNQQAVEFYNALGFHEVSRRSQDDFGYPFANATLLLQR